jgi:hypothetical protein
MFLADRAISNGFLSLLPTVPAFILGSLISLILTSRVYSSLDFSITDPAILEKPYSLTLI